MCEVFLQCVRCSFKWAVQTCVSSVILREFFGHVLVKGNQWNKLLVTR